MKTGTTTKFEPAVFTPMMAVATTAMVFAAVWAMFH